MTDPVRNNSRLVQRGLRQQDAKLFTTVAGSNISQAKRRFKTVGSQLQGIVAGLVPIPIVVMLEVVDIDHNEAHRVTVALRAAKFLVEPLFQVAPVKQSRQRISDRHELELRGLLLPLSTI